MTTTGAHPGLEHLLYEVKKVVVGQDHFLERVLVALWPAVISWWKACPAWPRP